MMNKTKWIVGLSIASVIALSSTAFAITSGSVSGLAPIVNTNQNQGTETDTTGSGTVNFSTPSTSQSTLQNNQFGNTQPATTIPPSQNNGSNITTSPGFNGNVGGYGMMGGLGANGNGGGYGMMGGLGANGNGGGYGMMGGLGTNGNGGGYGMMGGAFNSDNRSTLKNTDSAESDMTASLVNATVDKNTNTITYTGTDVKIVMLGGPPNADEKYVIGGLINPTLRIPQGAKVTMEIINEDEGMPHGVEITNATPPYAYMSMMQGGIYPGAFIHPIPEAISSQYPTAQVSFTASQTGEFYYLCQYPGHAEKGMYGKIIIG